MSKFIYFVFFFLNVFFWIAIAQNNHEGAYLLPNGNKLIISGQASSGFLFLRETETGKVFRLLKIDNLEFESENPINDSIKFIKCRFIKQEGVVRSLEIISQNGVIRNASKIPHLEEYSYFESGYIKLYGKLVLPSGPGPFPIVVSVQGSNSNSAIKNSFSPYLLASEGIATLVYDKRGTGLSQGTFTQLFDLLSDDVVSAINSLEHHPKLNLDRLGLIGFSQGGWVAPLAALKSGRVKYISIGYGLVMTISEEDLFEVPKKIADLGFKDFDIIELKEFNNVVHNLFKKKFKSGWIEYEQQLSKYNNRGWMKALKKTQTWSGVLLRMGVLEARTKGALLLNTFDPFYNPVPTLEKLNMPMHWQFGEEDIEAPPELSIKRLSKLIIDYKKKYTIKTYPGADHGIYLYHIEDNKRIKTHHHKNYLKDFTSWLKLYAGVDEIKSHHEKLPDLALKGLNVISMSDDSILHNQTIIIDNGTILDIYPNNNYPIKASKVIDASGKFVMPGLHDMHTHLVTTAFAKAMGKDNQFESLPYEDLLTVYLINGITTIQVLSGGEDLLLIRNKINNGKLNGPNIILGSPMVDGNPPILPEPFTKAIDKVSEVKFVMNEFKLKGYDFIKLRVNIPKMIFDEIIRYSKIINLPIIGHVPRGEGLSLEYVLSKKDFGVAHMEEFGYDKANPSDADIENYIKLLKENQGHVITTLNVFDNILDKMKDYDSTLKKEEVKFVHPLFKGLWQNNPFRQEQSNERYEQLKTQLSIQKVIVNKMYLAGVPIMLGTDALNPTIIPGYSIHRELELIIDSNLSQYDALRMATVIPAKLRNPNNKLAGTVKKGQTADLLILNNNPFDDITILKNPEIVIKKGKVFDKIHLKIMLNNLEKKLY